MRLRYIIVCDRDTNDYADIPVEEIIQAETELIRKAILRSQYLANEKFQIIIEEIK